MSKRIGLFVAVVSFCAWPQAPETATVRGMLHSDAAPVLHGFVVELDRLGARQGPALEADVDSDGRFVFRNLSYGDYLLKVTSYRGEALAQQFVTIHDGTTPIDVEMVASARPTPTGRTVSVSELQHPPARKAVDAVAAAQRFSQSGHEEKATGELQRALRISPDYAAAHSRLGVEYLRMERYDDAREELQRAVDLESPNPRDLANLSFALLELGRLPDAAEAARKALQVDRNYPPAHFILGAILAVRPESRGEGIAHLEMAARTMDSARRALDRLQRP